MSWLVLVIAGLFEVVWAVSLKASDGFRRPLPTVITIVALALSLGLLSVAARGLPIGTAYAVWVGIGAVGAALFGIIYLHEPATWPRLLFLGLLVVSLIGLKLTARS